MDQLSAFFDKVRAVLAYELFPIAQQPVTLGSIITFVLILCVALVLSRLAQRAVERGLRVRPGRDEGAVGVARRLTHYLVVLVGVGIALEAVGINLSALFAAGAIFAVGIGFAMQNITQNFVSGVILMVERSITPGDVLKIDGQFVRVERMGIRATHARTLDDEEIIVPNSIIVQSIVTNYTMKDSHYRLRTTVGVVYDSDMKLVRTTLEQAAARLPWRIQAIEPVILMTQFGSSSVDWEVSVWIDEPWQARRRLSALNETIWWALQDAGITIAFPQLDVHFDPPVVDAVTAVSERSVS